MWIDPRLKIVPNAFLNNRLGNFCYTIQCPVVLKGEGYVELVFLYIYCISGNQLVVWPSAINRVSKC